MIAIDTSVLIAITLTEPEGEDFLTILEKSSKVLISLVSVVETQIVIQNRIGHRGTVFVNDILRSPNFEIVSPGPDDMKIAYEAFVLYGKGSGHPANLNFGDLFSYALAKVRGVPLLFKGDDFSKTDIQAATSLQ